jgi:hypothetical protein
MVVSNASAVDSIWPPSGDALTNRVIAELDATTVTN